jgi:hypothetical protein
MDDHEVSLGDAHGGLIFQRRRTALDHQRSDIPDIERAVEPVDLPGGSDSSIDVKHHLAAPLNVGDGFAEGGEPIGRCDRYSNHA